MYNYNPVTAIGTCKILGGIFRKVNAFQINIHFFKRTRKEGVPQENSSMSI
ncbi:hypothetical protein BSG1_16365 [Bacillus sp. SG-1]|nr:hypothetical protein BSG1_16365 [Bacillus sp. SG-1]